MIKFEPFTRFHKLNPDGLLRNIRRQGTPDRVYFMELFQDRGLEDVIDERYGVTRGLDPADPRYELKRTIAMQRFLGYESFRVKLLNLTRGSMLLADDTADQQQGGGKRGWLNEHTGAVTSWREFEEYPWPNIAEADTSNLEWLCANLPDDMCLAGTGGHFCEYLCWFMGYETLCYALAEQRDLVEAIVARILELEEAQARLLLQFDRIRLFWGSDDMGFKTGLMFSPDDMRSLVLSGHKRIAEIVHEAGRPYLLHSCGKRSDILEDLIEDVKLDAIHSWEDTIELITDAKAAYGSRLALLGGMDVDFLCRADEAAIRQRVRDTVSVCMPGGGFCLGTGNTAANYIPADNYLAMLDEGRRL